MKLNMCARGHKAKYVLFHNTPFGMCAVFFSSKRKAIKYIGDFRHLHSLEEQYVFLRDFEPKIKDWVDILRMVET